MTAATIVIAPSNPIVSVGPILAVPGMRDRLDAARARGARIVAVSGIIGGRALKGPADRMLATLGHEPTALGVARAYAGLIDTFVLDDVDSALAPEVEALGIRAVVADIIMTDDDSRARPCRGPSFGPLRTGAVQSYSDVRAGREPSGGTRRGTSGRSCASAGRGRSGRRSRRRARSRSSRLIAIPLTAFSASPTTQPARGRRR